MIRRLETVSDGQLFAFTVLWVVACGLLLQLVALPFVVPRAHWGHGLINDLDSLFYHSLAIEQAQRIREQGWAAWELRPSLQFPAGLASALYVVIYPEPWVVLPVNGVLFGIVVTAVRRLLATMFGAGVALVSVAPFFVFPSFVPIWGQLQKDVTSGAGLALTLCALVVAGRRGRGVAAVVCVAMSAAVGMGLVWLARPYAVPVVGAAIALSSCFALLAVDGTLSRLRISMVVTVVLLSTVSGVQSWQVGGIELARAMVSSDGHQVDSSPLPTSSTDQGLSQGLRLRRIEPWWPTYAACVPYPDGLLVDRVLYSLCTVREASVANARKRNAVSGYDYEIRLRSIGDFIAYAPRAVAVALLEPGPLRWGAETSTVGRLATLFVPLEMVVAYASFLAAFGFAYRRLARADVWVVVTCCLLYSVCFVYSTPQLGTLYRMRAFAFTILVCTALAAVLSEMHATGLRPEKPSLR